MPSYAITTFGCQMNVHDSDRMHEVLRRAGYAEAAPEVADVIVLNTCSVREKAEQKLLSEVGRLAKQKERRPDLTVVVAGCVAQQEGEKLLAKGRAIDLVVGPDNIAELPALLSELDGGGLPVVRTVFDLDAPRFLSASTASGATAFVTIMKGCDERCSFCIVPYTRGPERYRASGEIVAEVRALTRAGVREVTLLGQTVNSYTDPSGALPRAAGASADPDESEFAALLWAIAREVPELARLRYTSPHPRHLTPSLVRAHAEIPVLARHVHLPVQSGSDRVLKRMIRRYTRDEYVSRVAALRAAVPDVTLSTDVIVGFPGETDGDFAETLELVREVGFTGLFGFKYSERPYTPARKLDDDVSEDVKGARLAQLFELSEAQIAAHLATLVGSSQRVLVDGRDKTGALWSGRSERNEIVHIAGASDRELAGEVVVATVLRHNKHSLHAELGPSPRDGLPRASRVEPVHQVPRRSLPLVTTGSASGPSVGEA